SKEDTTCVFYREDCSQGGCQIYELRPKACRLFPFRVEETTTASGDLLLNISFNPGCPGIGKGQPVDKVWLEKLVAEQFTERAEEVTARVRRLAAAGKISPQARVYRTFPGRK
ncbi:MAG: YkgJ family cysteine cluster protein, partial [Methanosarcinales archaeon]|nr:YkgJ family cysteine cluster protein [Methanosarcinales archaeon]